MVKRTKAVDTTVTSLQLGDRIRWRGISLVITEFFEDGSIEAMSDTMRVKVTLPEDFEKEVG